MTVIEIDLKKLVPGMAHAYINDHEGWTCTLVDLLEEHFELETAMSRVLSGILGDPESPTFPEGSYSRLALWVQPYGGKNQLVDDGLILGGFENADN